MKIALVGPAYPLRGGIAQYLALLYVELRKRHDVRFFSFYRQYPRLLFPGRTQREQEEPVLAEFFSLLLPPPQKMCRRNGEGFRGE